MVDYFDSVHLVAMWISFNVLACFFCVSIFEYFNELRYKTEITLGDIFLCLVSLTLIPAAIAMGVFVILCYIGIRFLKWFLNACDLVVIKRGKNVKNNFGN